MEKKKKPWEPPQWRCKCGKVSRKMVCDECKAKQGFEIKPTHVGDPEKVN